jgi:hypothetical protein
MASGCGIHTEKGTVSVDPNDKIKARIRQNLITKVAHVSVPRSPGPKFTINGDYVRFLNIFNKFLIISMNA